MSPVPVETNHDGLATEYLETKSVLPLLLIATGVVIYFVAIAAFASFPGVAVGVTVMVLGGTVYVCRSLARQPYSTPKPEVYPVSIDSDSMPDPLMASLSTQLAEDHPLFVTPEESEAESEETLMVH